MSARKKSWARCKRCFMRLEICICDLIPTIYLPTKIILICSKREFIAPANTGRLALLSLPNSVGIVRGDLEKPYDISEHVLNGEQLLLYPSEDAEVLTPDLVKSILLPATLVVPDGNWRQTFKMRRRDQHLAQMRPVKILPGEQSQYKIRKESKPEGLATIEAIARALGIIEGEHVQIELEKIFTIMVERIMASRGRCFDTS